MKFRNHSNTGHKAEDTMHYLRLKARHARLSLLAASMAAAAILSCNNAATTDVAAAVSADVESFFAQYDSVKGLPEFKDRLADIRKMDISTLAQDMPKEVTLGRTKYTNVAEIMATASKSLRVASSTKSASLESLLLADKSLGDTITKAHVEDLFSLVSGVLKANGKESATRNVLSKYTASQIAHAFNAAIIVDATSALATKSSGLQLLAPTPPKLEAPKPNAPSAPKFGNDPLAVLSPLTNGVRDLWGKNNEMVATKANAANTNACTAQTTQSNAQQHKESVCSTATPPKSQCLNKDSYPAFINGPSSVAQGGAPVDCSYKQWSCSCTKKDDESSCLLQAAGGVSAVVSTPCVPGGTSGGAAPAQTGGP